MTDQQIREIAFRRFELGLQAEKIAEEIKTLNRTLIAEAASRPQEHAPLEDSDGTAWTARAAGCEIRVVFPTDTLKASISEDSAGWKKIRALLESDLVPTTDLFTRSNVYCPVGGFRAIAEDRLGGKEGQKLIKLCTSASTPKVLIKETA